jgi:hypothetical protein
VDSASLPKQGTTQAVSEWGTEGGRDSGLHGLHLISLPSYPRCSGKGHDIGLESVRTVQHRHSRSPSGPSGPSSCCSYRCSSCSKRNDSCRTTLRSCCRSVSSWSGAVLPLSGSSESLGHGWRRPSGRCAGPGGRQEGHTGTCLAESGPAQQPPKRLCPSYL